MKFDFLKNKVFIISFIVLILFSFFNFNVFADSSFDANYDYLYNFKIDNSFDAHNSFRDPGSSPSADIQSIIDDNNKDDRIVSGDYFYFIMTDWDGLANVYIKSSAISNLYFKYTPDSSCVIYILFDDGLSSSDYFLKSGSWHGNDPSKHKICGCFFFLDYDNKILSTNFATNYPGNIPVILHDGSTRDFFLGAPTFTLTKEVGQIPEIMTKIIKQVLPIGLIVLGIGLLIYLIRRVLYSMK